MFLKIMNIQRVIFGLILFLLGINNIFKLIPVPNHAGFAGEFIQAMHNVHYIMPTIAIIQLFAGLSLICNRGINLGLILLLPISFNIFCFHALHEHSAVIPATILLGINLIQLILRVNVQDNIIAIRSSL